MVTRRNRVTVLFSDDEIDLILAVKRDDMKPGAAIRQMALRSAQWYLDNHGKFHGTHGSEKREERESGVRLDLSSSQE